MSKQKAFAKVAELGATLVDDGGVYQLEAPAGKICGGGDTHTRAFSYEDGIKDPWSGRTVWQDVLEELKHGFIDCPYRASGCDYCDPE